MSDFTPVIVNVTDYRQENCADIIFRVAGVQTQRRAFDADYTALKAAGFSDAAVLAFLATEPANG